jgi:tRNA A-37 threonylcarbamoyl transferase component Bud32
VAKIHRRGSVVEEIRRFDVFIRGWDNELRPQAYVHNDSAVILFNIISQEGDQAQPAEMLEACLRSLWVSELYSGDGERDQVELKASNIRVGLETLAAKLADLNVRRPATNEFPAHGYPDPVYIERIESRGIAWDLGHDAIAARLKAKEIFDALWPQATVHGDLHLKNVLIRGDRDPHLIDYAHSGPGHPAIDLVRLELALYSGHCRAFGSDDSFADAQYRLTVGMEDEDSLRRVHGDIFRSRVNGVSLTGSIAARNSAVKVLESFGGGTKDYLATKYLLAWQTLLLDGRQTSLIKGLIRALTPAVLAA